MLCLNSAIKCCKCRNWGRISNSAELRGVLAESKDEPFDEVVAVTDIDVVGTEGRVGVCILTIARRTLLVNMRT